MPPTRRVPTCHPERAHQARGLCSPCYFREYDKARIAKRRKDPSEYASNYRQPPKRQARVPSCHPNRNHAANGLCRPCYLREGPARATCHPARRLKADGLCGSCYAKRRYDEDPELHRQRSRESQARGRAKLREELLSAYGGQCACPKCPETNSAFLTLEHIGRTGKAHRARVGSHTYADLRRQGWPQDGYTLLCWNCNAATRHGKTCPHLE